MYNVLTQKPRLPSQFGTTRFLIFKLIYGHIIMRRVDLFSYEQTQITITTIIIILRKLY